MKRLILAVLMLAFISGLAPSKTICMNGQCPPWRPLVAVVFGV